MYKLIEEKILRLVHVDEAHQFVSFGSTFCPEFGDLWNTLLKKIIIHDGHHFIDNSVVPVGGCCLLKIPLLFMSATMTKDIVKYLQRLVGRT